MFDLREQVSGLNDNEKAFLVKDVYNVYFRDHLYGEYRSDDNIILSSGSVDHTLFPIADSLKYLIQYAFEKDWYGYSDSRGRMQARVAVALYENCFLNDNKYKAENICVTLGATAAAASLFDFIAHIKPDQAKENTRAICAVPNYPPMVKSLAQRFKIELVELEYDKDSFSLEPLIKKIKKDTPLVFLQTVINPSGKKVDEASLEKLIKLVSRDTFVVLDECHECFGDKNIGLARTSENVIRINSLSKGFLAPGMKLGWFVASQSFIERYYEYASSFYGSPVSIFYLFLEVLMIFESHRIREKRIDKKLFSHYTIPNETWDVLYKNYTDQIEKNEKLIVENRKFTLEKLRQAGIKFSSPSHSLNVLVFLPKDKNTYDVFLELLHQSKVSVYPGTLNFIFSEPCIRISPNIDRKLLSTGIEKIVTYLENL